MQRPSGDVRQQRLRSFSGAFHPYCSVQFGSPSRLYRAATSALNSYTPNRSGRARSDPLRTILAQAEGYSHSPRRSLTCRLTYPNAGAPGVRHEVHNQLRVQAPANYRNSGGNAAVVADDRVTVWVLRTEEAEGIGAPNWGSCIALTDASDKIASRGTGRRLGASPGNRVMSSR